jgi:hypothetical protein
MSKVGSIGTLCVTNDFIISLISVLQQQKVDAQNSSIFTTYTNPELGYSINYPSDWNKQHFPYFSTV